jgi:hypothetical protein
VLKGGDCYPKRRAGDERVSALLCGGEGLEPVVLNNANVARLVPAALQDGRPAKHGKAHARRRAHLVLVYAPLPLTGSASLQQVVANARVQLPLEELLVHVAAWAGFRGGELAALVSAQAEVRVSVAEATPKVGGRLWK